MSDMVILMIAAILIFGLLKVYSDKPQDDRGKTILTPRDRIIGSLVLLTAVSGWGFVQVGQYGIGNPLLYISVAFMGLFMVVNRLYRGSKKNSKK